MPTKKIKKRPKHRRKQKKQILAHHYFSSVYMLLIGCLFVFIIFVISYAPKPDPRIKRIDSYFAKYTMPLEGHGNTFVEAADRCDMDWRLLPAIAVRESTGGKRMIHNNPFGWGSAQIPFENFDEAIREVGWNLCGLNSSTAKWYATTSTYEKLYWYNGTVLHTYPDEVLWIMDQF